MTDDQPKARHAFTALPTGRDSEVVIFKGDNPVWITEETIIRIREMQGIKYATFQVPIRNYDPTATLRRPPPEPPRFPDPPTVPERP